MNRTICFAIFLALTPALYPQTPATAAIEGTVVDAAQALPIVHAQVILTKTGGALRDTLSAITDESGKFTIRDVPPATWRLFVEHDRYLRTEYGQRGPGRVGVPIPITAGQNLKLMVRMSAAGAIHGQVLNEYGDPLRNAVVKALAPRYADGKRSLDSVKDALTNDLGDFRIFGLTPGRYYISAEKSRAPQIEGNQLRLPSNTIAASTSVIPPSAFTTGIDVVAYYPNTNDERAAAPIEVASGATADAGNLVIRHTTGVHVKGKVTIGATIGQMLGDFRVEVWHLGGPVKQAEVAIHALSEGIAAGSTEGVFDFGGVAPGTYTIEASSGRGAENIVSGKIDIEVGDVDRNGLNIVVAPRLKTVNGRITVEGRGSVDNDPDVARINFILNGGAGARRVQPNGEFALTYVVPDVYPSSRITLMNLPAGWFIKTAHLGDSDILKDGLSLTTPPQTPIEIVISPNGAIVDGIVLDIDSKPMQGIRVVLVPDEPRRGRFELYQTVESDASGRAHFSGVPPGNYKLFGWDDVLPNQWQDAEFLKTQESRGVAVVLHEGERRQVELNAITGAR